MFTLTVTTLGLAASLAALVFSGALEPGMSRAIGTFLIGSGLMALFAGLRSHIVPLAIYVQEGPTVLMAAVAADFITIGGTTIADVFVLLVVVMLTTSLATATIAHLDIGGIGRSVPKPVVDAFVGGMGWLLIKGGIQVTTNSTLGLAQLGDLVDYEVAKFWVPGIAIGLIAWLANRSRQLPDYAFCIILGAAVAAFYTVVGLTSSVNAVEAGGWLLGPFPETGNAKWVTPTEFRTANWSAIAKTAPGIFSVVGIACIGVLINLTGIRSTLVPDLDLKNELRTSAGADLVAAPFGVTPGFQALGCTLVLHRMRSTSRAVALISGGLVVAFGIVGVGVVRYVPRFLVGALLTMIGLTLIDHWIRGLRRSASTAEKLLGVMIVGAAAWFGLLQAFAVGLVAAGVVFIASYSRVDPVRSTSTRRLMRSRADRLAYELGQLLAAGDRLVIFELQGYLFFGSLGTLQSRIHQAARGPDPAASMVIDFANVTGMDSSGCAAIARMLQELQRDGIVIRVSSLDPELAQTLIASEPELASQCAFLPSFNAALESAEDQLLASMSRPHTVPELQKARSVNSR